MLILSQKKQPTQTTAEQTPVTKADSGYQFYATDENDLERQIREFIREKGCFFYDECTGLYSTVREKTNKINIPEDEARDEFIKMFNGHCYEKKNYTDKNGVPKTSQKEFSEQALGRVFRVAAKELVYNGRLRIYEAIPEWDKVPRVETFLKDAYECDANPNLFKFFLNQTLSMLKAPQDTYCPYWFDFVGEQGVGKSYLCDWLFGSQLVCKIAQNRSGDDFKYMPYKTGALIAMDDECSLTQNQNKFKRLSIEEWRQYVSNRVDTVRGAYQREGQRQRTFIVVRTSNTANITQQRNERRQIIFESALPPRECRLAPTRTYKESSEEDPFKNNAGQYNMYYANQLLAEAKYYLEKDGQFDLTEEDIQSQKDIQDAHIDIEDTAYIEYSIFIKNVAVAIMRNNYDRLLRWGVEKLIINRRPSDYAIDNKLYGRYWIDYTVYKTYASEENLNRDRIISKNKFKEVADSYIICGAIPTSLHKMYGLRSSKNFTRAIFFDKDVTLYGGDKDANKIEF
ncbi:MAG: hypothetical protein II453_01890 [Alphaproteobacteria bacterium]|nr:hypothetical protein [Alphaproteobacteria bacterium]